MIEQICALPPIATALDAIIERFGIDQVAEVTGRTRRLIVGRDGRQKLQSRSPRANVAETQAFMDELAVGLGAEMSLAKLGMPKDGIAKAAALAVANPYPNRSEEHTSELQSLMRISYAVFCLKKQTEIE